MKKVTKLASILIASTMLFGTAMNFVSCSSDSDSTSSPIQPEGNGADGGNNGSVTLIIEENETAKGFVSSNVEKQDKKNNVADWTGTGFLDNPEYIIYSVNSPIEQDAELVLRYAYWGNENKLRAGHAVINGKSYLDESEIFYCNQKGKNLVLSNKVTVKLVKGENQIRLQKVPAGTELAPYSEEKGYGFVYPANATITSDASDYGVAEGYFAIIDNLQITTKQALSKGANTIKLSTLKISSENDDYGTVTVSSTDALIKNDTEVTVTATPKSGYKFDCWSGTVGNDLVGSNEAEYKFNISGETTLIARFIPESYVNAGLEGYATISDDAGTKYTITGGEGGSIITIANLADLKANMDKLKSTTPYIVNVTGLITTANETNPNVSVGCNIGSNKTLTGTTAAAQFQNVGLTVSGENIIIKNIKFGEVIADHYYAKKASANGGKAGAADAIELNGAKHIWIDHCEFQSHLTPMAFNESGVLEELTFDKDITLIQVEEANESPEIAWRKDYYDGLLDIKNQSSFITVSNCYFHDHYKASLLGSNDTDDREKVLRITYCNNYWKNINARQPLIRFGKAHIYNSVYESESKDACPWVYMTDDKNGNSYSISDKIQSTAINCRAASEVLAENNYFENLKTAIGHYNGSSDVPGTWTTKGNTGFSDVSNNSYTPAYTEYTKTKATKDEIIANAGVGK